MKSKKVIIGGLIALLILAATIGVLFWVLRGTSDKRVAVYVQQVSSINSADNGIVSRWSGMIETQQTEKVKLDSSKMLGEIFVKVGDTVSVGSVLFSYNTEAQELELNQMELELERMDTTIANDEEQIAQLQRDMYNATSSDKPAFAAQIQQLQADLAQTQYDKKTKQAEIEKQQVAIRNSTVTATMAGTVDSIADPNTLNGSGFDMYGNPTEDAFITIIAHGDFRVKGTISEQNIGNIYEGMAMIIRSRVDDKQIWKGVISTISTQNETENNNFYYNIGESASKYTFYVDLESIDGLLLGQHVTIEPDYGQVTEKEGIWINGGWIDFSAGSFVWACKEPGSKLEKREVVLGEYDENLDIYQIISGIRDSEYIAWPDSDCRIGAKTTSEYIYNLGDSQSDNINIFDNQVETENEYEEIEVVPEMPMENN